MQYNYYILLLFVFSDAAIWSWIAASSSDDSSDSLPKWIINSPMYFYKLSAIPIGVFYFISNMADVRSQVLLSWNLHKWDQSQQTKWISYYTCSYDLLLVTNITSTCSLLSLYLFFEELHPAFSSPAGHGWQCALRSQWLQQSSYIT